MKTYKKKFNPNTVRCPYCGGRAVLRSSKGIYPDKFDEVPLYVCINYPECDSYVRADPQSKIPLGTMANRKLRSLRIEAHKYFNKLYEDGYMTKDEAYEALRSYMTLGGKKHIAELGDYGCMQVIKYCRQITGAI